MSPRRVLGKGRAIRACGSPCTPPWARGASVLAPAPPGRSPAAFACEPEPSGRARMPAHLLSRLFAASCASYNFSFLSPQGLSLAPQGSSSPFWPGTAALGAWGRPAASCPARLARGHPLAHGPCLTASAAACGGCWQRHRARDGEGGGLAGGRGCCRRRGHRQARLGAALLTPSPGTLPRRPLPCLSATVLRCSLRALPLVAANSQAATLGGSWEWSLRDSLWSWDLAAGGQGLGGPDRTALHRQSPPQALRVSPFSMVVVTCALTPGSQPEPVRPGFQSVWRSGTGDTGEAAMLCSPIPDTVRARTAQPPTGHVTPVRRAREGLAGAVTA